MRKKLSKILIIFFLMMCVLTTISVAKGEAVALEKSEEYKNWESLSEEERENTIVPRYYNISIKDSVKRSKYLRVLAGNTSLESVYNLADLYNAIIKDQKKTMSCWAFSTTSMLESNIAVRNNLPVRGYSPFHMEYYTTQMYDRAFADGGNIYQALAYMTNGYGPVLESDFPMESVYDETNNTEANRYLTNIGNVDLDKVAQLKVNRTTEFPEIHKEYTGSGITYSDGNETTYTENEVEVLREKVKTHIKEYGAVVASMYIDIAINTGGEFVSDFYDSENNIFCCTDNSKTSNHQVTIVGWDDTKEAYIVQNSYGEEFGDNGYFYISYDDVFIEEGIYGITEIEKLTANKYDNIYQYDELGMNNAITFGTSEIYYANVFTRNANADEEEYINEVGLYISNTTGVEIYVNAEDGEFIDESTNSSKLKLVSSGEILEPGYNVIKLNATEDTKLTGDKFIVAVKAIQQEGAWVPIETNLKESRFVFFSNPYDTAEANVGESLYSRNGTMWNDINGVRVGNIITLANTNVCVRAFTKYADSTTDVAATGVKLDKTSITLKEGETELLTETVLPVNATNKNVTWTSSNTSVATISNGVVTAVNEGTATITVKTEDGNYTATTQITVEEATIGVTGVTLTPTTAKVEKGKTTILIATVLPLNATNKNVTWTSSNESVATVVNGVVTGIDTGTAQITVKTEDGSCTATAQITVEENASEEVSVTSVTLDKSSEILVIGETLRLVPTILPSDATNQNVTWTSSNRSVAIVVGGIVTALQEGNSTITVKTVDGNYTATCQITVVRNEVSVTSITLNKTNESLKVGEKLSLIPIVLPLNATNKNVTWTSSNESVATVSSGVVTGIKIGEATITAKTEDGNHTATCKVTVEGEKISVTGVTITVEPVKLKVGDTLKLSAEVSPANATNKNITWESSDEEVAKIINGVVNALKVGKATITVRTVDGNFTDKFTITVIENSEVKVESVGLSKAKLQMEVSDKATLTVIFNPENPTNTNVEWASSNTEVATVDANGIVTAVGPGQAIIGVKSEDGEHVATCVVTVTKQVKDPDDIYKEKEEGDTTGSDKNLPYTGMQTVAVLMLITIVIIMGYSFIKYRRLKDIK